MPKRLIASSWERRPEPGLPFVYVNVAVSADGKLAPAHRRFVPFSSKRDQELLMLLRTEADAVMAGARTVYPGKVDLGPGGELLRRRRRRNGLKEYNLRVVVSGSGNLSPKAHIFQERFSPVIVLTTERAPKERVAKLRRVAGAVEVVGEKVVDFVAALKWLRKQWDVRTLLSEGGGELNAALFEAGLVHELFMTISPVLIGGATAPTLADGRGVERIGDATQLNLRKLKRVNDELFLVYDVVPK